MNMVMISEELGLWAFGAGTLEAMHKRRFEGRGEGSDLLQPCGTILCTVEIDPRSGAIWRPQGLALVRLLASLGQAEFEARPLAAAPMAN